MDKAPMRASSVLGPYFGFIPVNPLLVTKPRIIVSSFFSSMWKVFVVCAVVWFVLKQLFRKALLPVPLARVWGRIHFFFWRLCLEVSYNFGHRQKPWKDVIENRVWLGKTVLARHVPELRRLGITRVLNLQDENPGPVEAFRAAGIEQLHVPVVDHFEPSVEQLHVAVDFLEKALHEDRRVYVHCQGGHGRSAAVVFAHLALQEEQKERSLEQINRELNSKWRVRGGLHSQPAVKEFVHTKKGHHHHHHHNRTQKQQNKDL